MIRFQAILVHKKLVAHELNGCMSDESIIITALDLFYQLQVLLGHPEEHFDIPPLTVDPDEIFVRKVDIVGYELLDLSRSPYYCQPAQDNGCDVLLMCLIDEQFTKTPSYGVRRMMGIESVYPKPRLSKASKEHGVYPSIY